MKLNSKLVLIRVEEAPEQDASGVYVQDEWVANRPIGTVEEVADDVSFCKVGDRVWFERYTALQDPNDENTRICREDAVLAVYDNDDQLEPGSVMPDGTHYQKR